MRRSSFLLLSVALLSPLVLAGCTTCGEGTGMVNGECVPVQPIEEEDTDVVEVDTSPGETLPEITSFTTNVTEVTQLEIVTFTVGLTDPQGEDDIAIGVLQAPGGTPYGDFAASGGGIWTITIAWADLNSMNSIEFDLEEERNFVAHFVDRSSNVVEATTSLRLHCEGLAACSGDCTNLDTDTANCGTCGAVCDECASGQCYGYECVETGSSVDTCDETCASEGKTCGGDVCGGGTTTGWMIAEGRANRSPTTAS